MAIPRVAADRGRKAACENDLTRKNMPATKKNRAKLASKAMRENCKCQGEMAKNKAATKTKVPVK